MIAAAASALADRVFGFEARWVWVLVFGAITTALALLGPISFVRTYVRRFAVWVVLASLGYLSWWTLAEGRPRRALVAARRGRARLLAGSRPDRCDVGVVAPARGRLHALRAARPGCVRGTALGYFVPHVWLFALGALPLLSRGLTDPAGESCRRSRPGAPQARSPCWRSPSTRRTSRSRMCTRGRVAPEPRAARAAAVARARLRGGGRRWAR